MGVPLFCYSHHYLGTSTKRSTLPLGERFRFETIYSPLTPGTANIHRGRPSKLHSIITKRRLKGINGWTILNLKIDELSLILDRAMEKSEHRHPSHQPQRECRLFYYHSECPFPGEIPHSVRGA